MRSTFIVISVIGTVVENFNQGFTDFATELAVKLRVTDEEQMFPAKDTNGFIHEIRYLKDFSGRPRSIQLFPNIKGEFRVVFSSEDSSAPKEFVCQFTEDFFRVKDNVALQTMREFFNVE